MATFSFSDAAGGGHIRSTTRSTTSIGASVRRSSTHHSPAYTRTEEKKDDTIAMDAKDCSVDQTLASAKPGKKLDQYFQRCQKEFEEKMVPVVIFTGVDANNIEKARNLWESSRVTRTKVMFTRLDPSTATCQLVIYELASELHEVMIEMLSHEINQYIDRLGCLEFILKVGTATYKRSDEGSEMEGDKAYKQWGGRQADGRLTLVVEVGWSQDLGPVTNGKTLLGKAKDWIDIDASLVLAVKVYGSKPNENPGMLVSLVTGDGVIRVIRAGKIPAGELEHFTTYNQEYAGADAGPVTEMLQDTQTLEIDGKYILGFGPDGLQGQIDLFPETNENEDTRQSRKHRRIRGALQALQGRIDFGRAINLGNFYEEFLDLYDRGMGQV